MYIWRLRCNLLLFQRDTDSLLDLVCVLADCVPPAMKSIYANVCSVFTLGNRV